MRTTVIAILTALCGAAAQAAPAPIERRITRYSDDKLASERFFQNGKKVGIHKTWYANGRLKSEAEFERPDQTKVYKIWFENGRLAKVIVFKNGMESETKIYRETGQIYLNRVVRDGRVYGLPGGKACARVKTGET